jgi:hypothetical protein
MIHFWFIAHRIESTDTVLSTDFAPCLFKDLTAVKKKKSLHDNAIALCDFLSLT